MEIQELTERIEQKSVAVRIVVTELEKVIVGQKNLIDRLLIGMLCDGHLLIEGLPGLAKTTAVKRLASIIDLSFQRIQFTPDLLPADITGTQIYRPDTSKFEVKKGPIFHNIILADEINRAPAKVQSALLEAMQEKQVTVGNETFMLPLPFLVLATQNPIEQEGTYPLPEAQVDRFMLKLKVTYPNREQEKEILKKMGGSSPDTDVDAVVEPSDIKRLRKLNDEIYMDEKIEDYILDLVQATRNPEEYGLEISDLIQYGASPRATLFLAMASRAYAFLQGRGYVTPQDIKSIGMDVLRHRVIITYEAEAEEKVPEDIVSLIFDNVPVP